MKIMPPVGYDMNRALPLLQEYTSKVRDACRSRLEQRTGWRLWGTLNALVTLALVAAHYGAASHYVTEIVLEIVLAVAALLGAVFTQFQLYLPGAKDAARLAGILKRLTTIVSQYNDHTPDRFRDPLEAALRLTEADAALAMYRTTFGRPPSSDVELPAPLVQTAEAPAPLAGALQPRP